MTRSEPEQKRLAELATLLRGIFELADRLDWKSHDPFDLLLSPYLRAAPSLSSLAGRALVQVGRRSGSSLRRGLRVPVHEEPKTLAEFLRSALLLIAAGNSWAERYITPLSARLRALALPGRVGCGWGITFPYVSRFGYIAPETPTLYDTTLACQALLDHFDWREDEEAFDAAAAGCQFVLNGLGRFEHDGRQWLPYVPGSTRRVVNVQASAASLFARVGVMTDDERLLRHADAAAATVLGCQRPDGSWPYSDERLARFVDGFHTGFTLQGLSEYAATRRGPTSQQVVHALGKGFEFFEEHLLTADGLPRGFADGAPSLDGQNAGQCIQTLVAFGGRDGRETAMRIWAAAFADLSNAKLVALRWSFAPAALAGAHLLS